MDQTTNADIPFFGDKHKLFDDELAKQIGIGLMSFFDVTDGEFTEIKNKKAKKKAILFLETQGRV